jgi:pimeloyl-ACP methyl ester carboxylesterase
MTDAALATVRDGQFAQLPNGIRLHYASAGERGRPLVLFVHGFPEFWYAWRDQLAEFGQDFFAVAPDLRGFNLSDMPADLAAYKARHIVDDLRLLIADLGYERCIMVAHDWGGAVAWNFAIALPQLLEKLVIINSPHPYLFMKALATDPQQIAASEYMNWLRAEGAEDALAKNEYAVLEKFMHGLGEIATPWYDTATAERYRACWARGLTGGLNYYRASPLHPPTEGHLGPLQLQLNPEDFRIKVPTRVIWGERDIALLTTLLDGLDGLIDDLQVARIPDATHWVIHERPQQVNRLLRGFLQPSG